MLHFDNGMLWGICIVFLDFLVPWCSNSNGSAIFKLLVKFRIQWYIICPILVTQNSVSNSEFSVFCDLRHHFATNSKIFSIFGFTQLFCICPYPFWNFPFWASRVHSEHCRTLNRMNRQCTMKFYIDGDGPDTVCTYKVFTIQLASHYPCCNTIDVSRGTAIVLQCLGLR